MAEMLRPREFGESLSVFRRAVAADRSSNEDGRQPLGMNRSAFLMALD